MLTGPPCAGCSLLPERGPDQLRGAGGVQYPPPSVQSGPGARWRGPQCPEGSLPAWFSLTLRCAPGPRLEVEGPWTRARVQLLPPGAELWLPTLHSGDLSSHPETSPPGVSPLSL